MSNYNATREMVESASLQRRVVAAVAGEGILSPEQWTRDQMWYLASDPGWVESWTYARETETLDHNPDTGARPGVINDEAILSVVQARIEYLESLEPQSGEPPDVINPL